MSMTSTVYVCDIRNCVEEFRKHMVAFPYKVIVSPLLKNRCASFSAQLEFDAGLPTFAYPAYVRTMPILVKVLFPDDEEYKLFKEHEKAVLQDERAALTIKDTTPERMIAFANGMKCIRRVNNTDSIFNAMLEDFKYLLDHIEAVESNIADSEDYSAFKNFYNEIDGRWDEVKSRIYDAILAHENMGPSI